MMRKFLFPIAFCLYSGISFAHEYSKGGFEIDSFKETIIDGVHEVLITVHSSNLQEVQCRALDINDKPLGMDFIVYPALGWHTLTIVIDASAHSVSCQSR